jgi:hypothetical protein
MNWILLLRARAEADIAKARDRYNKARLGLGDEFLSEVGIVLRKIEDPERPLIY